MRRLIALIATLAAASGAVACGGDERPSPSPSEATGGSSQPVDGEILSGSLPLLNGDPQPLAQFRGEVVLIVNTATECGFTPQFENLEQLYERHRDDGFVVLGFPADDVAGQEPRDDAAIAEFCEENFGVSFPMFAKSNVVEAPLNPVFEKLGAAAGPPTWNFNKYLLGRDGDVVEHWDAGTAPDDDALTGAIEEQLSAS